MSRARTPTAEPSSTIGAPPMSMPVGGAVPPIAGAPQKVLPGAAVLPDGTNYEVINPSNVLQAYDPTKLANTDGMMYPKAPGPTPVHGGYFAPGERVSPPVRRWVVLEDFQAGNFGIMRRGKTIDESNYNIDRLVTAGLRIEEIPHGYLAADVLLGRVKPKQNVETTAAATA